MESLIRVTSVVKMFDILFFHLFDFIVFPWFYILI